jgi:predicted PurR-regulated permease PerM
MAPPAIVLTWPRMQQSEVSASLVAKVVVVTAAVVGTIYFLYLTLQVIELFVIAIFFALAIAPAVNWLNDRRVPRWAAILLVYQQVENNIVRS